MDLNFKHSLDMELNAYRDIYMEIPPEFSFCFTALNILDIPFKVIIQKANKTILITDCISSKL